jgi:hypothetical protein
MNARTVAIDPKDLERGIEALSSAGQAFRLTRFERGAYYLLKVSVDVTVWSFIALSLLSWLPVTWVGGYDISAITGAVVVYGTLLAAIALVINIPLASKLYRERARLKELGLASLSKSLWKESRRGRRIRQAVRWGPVIILVIIFSFMLADRVFTRGDENWDAGDTAVVVIFTILAALLVLARYLRNQRERIDLAASAEELKIVFQGLQQRAGKAEVVSVPSELLEKAARIESAQIAKERRDAVLQSVSVGPSGYAVTFDRAAAEQRGMLDVSDRVELEDRVAQISIEGPGKLTSQVGPPEGATLQCETKSKRVEIEYVVDRTSHGIRVVAVRSVGGGSHSSPNGHSHA